MPSNILIVILILLLLAVTPAWPYSKSWGYWPTGLVSIILIIVIIMLLLRII